MYISIEVLEELGFSNEPQIDPSHWWLDLGEDCVENTFSSESTCIEVDLEMGTVCLATYDDKKDDVKYLWLRHIIVDEHLRYFVDLLIGEH